MQESGQLKQGIKAIAVDPVIEIKRLYSALVNSIWLSLGGNDRAVSPSLNWADEVEYPLSRVQIQDPRLADQWNNEFVSCFINSANLLHHKYYPGSSNRTASIVMTFITDQETINNLTDALAEFFSRRMNRSTDKPAAIRRHMTSQLLAEIQEHGCVGKVLEKVLSTAPSEIQLVALQAILAGQVKDKPR